MFKVYSHGYDRYMHVIFSHNFEKNILNQDQNFWKPGWHVDTILNVAFKKPWRGTLASSQGFLSPRIIISTHDGKHMAPTLNISPSHVQIIFESSPVHPHIFLTMKKTRRPWQKWPNASPFLHCKNISRHLLEESYSNRVDSIESWPCNLLL